MPRWLLAALLAGWMLAVLLGASFGTMLALAFVHGRSQGNQIDVQRTALRALCNGRSADREHVRNFWVLFLESRDDYLAGTAYYLAHPDEMAAIRKATRSTIRLIRVQFSPLNCS